PEGCGIFFVRGDVAERLTPTTVGWTNFEGWLNFAQGDPVWRKGAGRFECGALNSAGIHGLEAAFGMISQIGVATISERILHLTHGLREGLQARGYRLFGPAVQPHRSGIVSFFPRSASAEELAGFLRNQQVIVSARRGLVRISPHFYNTQEEIDRVLELLR
ncbi:MAG TPA: aminotransferase class V-fold PLP-dependent enzyme, partial [Terriglobia bacterium]|nr:aminotransferase class V-fold PLP-dependent enzyme [Terriglobia bacterium]